MKIMMNYVLSYGSSLSDVLIAKLTCFYNKVLLEESTRLIFLLPESTKLARADLHKSMFDEIIVSKFDPTNTRFWNVKKLYHYLFFTLSAMNTDYQHLYIGHGKIAKTIDLPEGKDIIVANSLENEDIIQYTNKQLEAHCDLPLLDSEDLILYDCSVFFISDDLRASFQGLIGQIVKTYPEYIDDLCSYAIISCVMAHLMKTEQFSIHVLEQDITDISDCGLIEDFYTLI